MCPSIVPTEFVCLYEEADLQGLIDGEVVKFMILEYVRKYCK